MAFTDPLALTIDGGTKNLVRVRSNGQFGSEYLLTESAQEFRAFIRTQELGLEADGRRQVRHNISLRWTVFKTLTTAELVRQTSMTVSHYKGDDVTKWDDTVLAVSGLGTIANAAKLNNYES
jgi:hypothetical protein